MYMNGTDVDGRPIIIVKPGSYNPFPIEMRINYVIWLMEEAIRSSTSVEKLTWILDFSDYGKRASSPDGRQVGKSVLHIRE
jgi:hypothetical protein